VLAAVLLIAILLLAAAGIGGGLYLIARPDNVVDVDSPTWRPIVLVLTRVAGAAMVGVVLLVAYLIYWMVTGGPGE
jgi:hypothetical protein